MVRPRRQRQNAHRRPVRPGHRWRHHLRRHPGHDRADVPRAPRARPGDRRLQLRRVGRRHARLLRRRRADPGARLALDLLRQPAHRARRLGAGGTAVPDRAGTRPGCRSGPGRCRPGYRWTDARRVRDRRDGPARLGLRVHDRVRRRRDRAARRVRRPRSDRDEPAAAVAGPALAQRRRWQRRPGPDGGRRDRVPVPQHPVPATGSRVRAVRGWARRGPGRAGDRDHLARLLRAPRWAVRPAYRAAGRPGADRGGARVAGPGAGRRPVRRRHPARGAAARHRRRWRPSGGDLAGHVGCHRERLGAGVRAGQHHPADRGRVRPRGPGHARRVAHRGPGRCRSHPDRGTGRRVPVGVRRRRGSRGRRPPGRAAGATPPRRTPARA
jgi:hypothetical protein